MIIGVLGFDIISLTVSTSVTFSSWGCSFPSRLARFPNKLDLMPGCGGYARAFGWVRTGLLANPD